MCQNNKTQLILINVKITFIFYIFSRICYNICEIHRIAFVARVIVIKMKRMCFLYSCENLF